MDELIFQEFKGTGNMEMVLDRKAAELRLWPAINLNASGTRKEELILSGKNLEGLSSCAMHWQDKRSKTPQRQ